jgi:hypothetical protein
MRLFTLIIISMLTLQTFAGESILRVNLEHGHSQEYKVVIGQKTVKTAANFAEIFDLYAGRHVLKVYSKRENPIGTSEYARYKRIHYGFIDIPANSKIFASYEHDHGVKVNRVESLDVANNDCDQDDHNDQWNNDESLGDVVNNGGVITNGGGSYYHAISEQEFANILAQLKRESYDGSRVALMKRTFPRKRLRTEQLMMLLSTFTFGSYKMEMAKLLRFSVTDQAEFWRLEDVFVYDSYKRQIREMTGRTV